MTAIQPTINLIFDRRHVATTRKKAPLEMRITYDYKQKYLSTGIMLYSNQWRNGNIVNCADIVQVSNILNKLLTDVRQIILDMMEEGYVDISLIPDKLEQKNKIKMSFLDYCKKRADIRKYGKEKDTKERYDRFLRLFSAWGKIKTFEDIKDETIIVFDRYLVGKGMKSYSKWNNYHRFLKGFILDAIDEGLLQRNPYKWVNIEKGEASLGIDKCLTIKEFRKLKKAKMPTESLTRVRDLFIFQTYTCLRYSDLAKFNKDNIITINSKKVYRCVQKKTKKYAIVPLSKDALHILYKYNNVLPVISNVKYNAYLKVVAQAAGLKHPLSTHWARHTGATILLNEGVDMQVVTKVCGHSSTKITEQIYAKLLDETVVDAVSSVKI